jgi:hypothetical protein
MPEPYNPSPAGNPSLLKRRSWPETQLVKFIGRHTPKCPEVVRILSQGMDQKLTLKTRLLLNMHYLICRWCQRYSEHLRYLRKFSRRFPEQISTLDVFTMPASTKDRIKQLENRPGRLSDHKSKKTGRFPTHLTTTDADRRFPDAKISAGWTSPCQPRSKLPFHSSARRLKPV